MTVTRDISRHGFCNVEAVRVDGKLSHVYLTLGVACICLKPTLKAMTALRHAADLIDQSLAFDGCERPVDTERKETP